MKIAIFGGTGFIGSALQIALKKRGHEFKVLDIRHDKNWESQLSDVDGVINLAGAPLFAKRWNTRVMVTIHESRIRGTEQIVAALGRVQKLNGKNLTLINASAVGFYGTSKVQTFTEDSACGTDFLAMVCRDWETEAQKAQNIYNIRTAIVRFGIVLGANGGALKSLLLPFKMFLGGPINLGGEWMSWVHIDDAVGVLLHTLENEDCQGAYNACSPNPVSNKEFSQALGAALMRPSWLPLPSFALRIMVGAAARIITKGQRVLPARTLKAGYRFQYPDIYIALKSILSATQNEKVKASNEVTQN